MYLILNIEDVYSHFDESVNCKQISFEFSRNVPIYIYFDAKESMLTFKNGKTNETFTMKIQRNGEDLHGCVNAYL
jgi:hypothetical protein